MAEDPSLNNPAGRLYSLLIQLREFRGNPIRQAWASALGVDADDVSRHMSEVARLVWDLDRVLSTPGMERAAAPINRYKPQLLEAAFPMATPFDNDVTSIIPPEEAYDALGLLADYLATAAPEGPIPSEEEQADLLEKLQALIDEVTAEELPDNVMRLVLERLRGVREALENIRTGGPGAVQRATEALLGAAFASSVTNEKAGKSKVMGRVIAVVGGMWIAFTAGPTTQKSLEAWTTTFHDLTSGPAQIQHAQPAQAQPPRAEQVPPEDEETQAK
jgi:hypothetical protein